MLEFDDETASPKGPVIKVIGVGGGGGNALNTMIEGGIEGVDFIVANTDCQVLEANQAPIKVHLGKTLTKGLGAGANPEIGKAAALEDASRVAESLAGADMVFVTAGMGGGTGTGAAPVIAQVARDLGALTVGVVTKPFAFEGSHRKKKASAGISELAKAVDALIVIPNDRLVTLAGVKMTLKDAFAMVDNVLLNAVRGISDLVTVPGLINVDFADVRTIMTGMGRALMGTGRGKGEKRALEAAQQAISSPLLEDVSINGATGILINITGGPDLTLSEVNEAASLIEEAADPGANIIFGSVIDAHAGDEVRITVIATGFQPSQQDQPLSHASAAAVGGGRGHGATLASGGRRTDQMALPMNNGGGGFGGGMAVPQVPQGQPYHVFGHAAPPAPTSIPVPMAPSAGALPTAAWTPGVPLPGARSTPPQLNMHTAEMTAEPGEFDDPYAPDYGNGFPTAMPMAPMPLAPSAAIALGGGAGAGGPATAAAGTIDWSSAPTAERPIIRPPVAANPGLRGRASATMTRSMGASDQLGVEESEFDKPTYLRRGIAPE